MKHIDEYRDKRLVAKLVRTIESTVTRRWTIMEICGGQTHSIMKYNLMELLPDEITLIHGPGCPVCVTPVELIDRALELGSRPDVILVSFGDMLRVPGTHDDLLQVKAKGGDIRMVYAPLDALDIAQKNPGKEVVFFGVGFETTAPAVALAIRQAKKRALNNFSVLVSHVLVPPAIRTLLEDSQNRIDGFLAAGHVCTIMGTREYIPLASQYKLPIVVTGFEPVDILLGIQVCIDMLEKKRTGVENAYLRSVKPEGNPAARELLQEVFVPVDRKWRGIGTIPGSGLGLTDSYLKFDASLKFDLQDVEAEEANACLAGEVLTGRKKPSDCPAFATRCRPEHPLGAPMVSTEGACSAYYRYNRSSMEYHNTEE
ncbi:MAG: hydrogenase formation protein HypD [Bacteroidota bacterium]|nr:hydrogenase formation protein HypD [Bacteroidota bacterium]